MAILKLLGSAPHKSLHQKQIDAIFRRNSVAIFCVQNIRVQGTSNIQCKEYRLQGSGRATQHRNISTFPIHIMNYVCIYIYIYLYVRIRWCTVHINLHYSIHSIIVYHCIIYYPPYYLRINPPISSTVLLSTQCRRITTPIGWWPEALPHRCGCSYPGQRECWNLPTFIPSIASWIWICWRLPSF